MGEHKLDSILMNLLQLLEMSRVVTLSTGCSVLVRETKELSRTIQKEFNDTWNLWKQERKVPGANLESFCLEAQIPFDVVSPFPFVFSNWRRTIHALRLAWSVFLTLKMHRVLGFHFPQRMRGNKFRNKDRNHLTSLFLHYYNSLEGNDERIWIKQIKNSLCYRLSIELNQDELPEGLRFDILPFSWGNLSHLAGPQRIQVFFSVLQGKILCEAVPDSFIQKSLEEHREKLSNPGRPITEEMKILLRERGLEFGKRVQRFYKSNTTFPPTVKATFESPRASGGIKGELIRKDRVSLNTIKAGVDPKDRPEPLVIGLFGQPGGGKSSILNALKSHLMTFFPGTPWSELSYERTCNTEHWDGYSNQPITVLDDLGQSLEGKDLQEFQTLVSCNPYVLPMAELSEKGTMFSSSVIIVTSNLRYGCGLKHIYKEHSILDDNSFWRRFHVPIQCELGEYALLKETPIWTDPERLVFTANRLEQQRRSLAKFENHLPHFPSVADFDSNGLTNKWIIQPLSTIFAQISKIFHSRKRFFSKLQQTWTQTIKEDFESTEKNLGFLMDEINSHLPESLDPHMIQTFQGFRDGKSNSFTITYPAYPPTSILPVRVEPIVEPLKVRTITAGIGDCFCLKPFQRAMWMALGTYDQFCLTHGTNNLDAAIERIHAQSSEGDVWISGDYSAATDSVPIEVSKILLESILESIDHEPTRRWAMKEISPHLLVYPKNSGLNPVIQQSGQLMGSFLSFPLLCLLNDCTAISIGLKPAQYLINGDDILMRCSPMNYPQWKVNVGDLGLELSLGKNYVHPSFGTVNSQLIHQNRVLFTGKQAVLDRKSGILAECLRDLEIAMSETSAPEVHELFKTINRQKLAQTIRSIDVPMSHGGLSFNWNSENLSYRSRLSAQVVYFHDLFQKLKPKKGFLIVPYQDTNAEQSFKVEKLEEQAYAFESLLQEENCLKLKSTDVISIRKRIRGHPFLRKAFNTRTLESLPALTFVKTIEVPFTDEKVRSEIQDRITISFLSLFFDYTSSFTFEDYKQHMLFSLGKCSQDITVSKRLLVNIFDLNLQVHHLSRIGCSSKSILFESERFTAHARDGSPRNIQLNDFTGPDFSQEVRNLSNRIEELLQINEDDLPFLEEEPKEVLAYYLSDFNRRRNSPTPSLETSVKDEESIDSISLTGTSTGDGQDIDGTVSIVEDL